VRLRRLSVLLAELQAISPMPSDEELIGLPAEGSRRLDKYVELLEAIRQETTVEFSPEVVSVLLSSLHLIESFPDEHLLYAFIQQATKSPNPGTRKWCCLLLGRRRSIDDLPFLLDRLKDEMPAVRTAALLYGIALLAEGYPLPQAIPVVAELLNDDQESVREYAREVMATLRG